MGFILQSEGIADAPLGQHKYGQRHLRSDRKSIISTHGTGAYQRLLAVVMTKVQLLSMKAAASRAWQSSYMNFANPSHLADPSGSSTVKLLVYWQPLHKRLPPIKTQSWLEQHCPSVPFQPR
jgi:hypothetical protein